jgi:hypothetical protein
MIRQSKIRVDEMRDVKVQDFWDIEMATAGTLGKMEEARGKKAALVR